MFQNPYRIYRYSLLLACLVFGIGMVYLNVWFLGEFEYPILSIHMIFVYAVAPYSLLGYFKIPSNLLEEQIKFDIEKINPFTDDEREQIRRKSEFNNAFQSESDKREKENERSELKIYNDHLVEGEKTYSNKKPGEMNDFEYFHHLSTKITKVNDFGNILATVISMVFATLYFHLSVTVPYYIGVPIAVTLLIIAISHSIYGHVTWKKLKYVKKKITPKAFDNFLNEFGINFDD